MKSHQNPGRNGFQEDLQFLVNCFFPHFFAILVYHHANGDDNYDHAKIIHNVIWFEDEGEKLSEANALSKYSWQTFHLFTYFLSHALPEELPLKTRYCRNFSRYIDADSILHQKMSVAGLESTHRGIE